MVKSLDYVIKNVCIVRHTPPFGHPSPRGDGAVAVWMYRYVTNCLAYNVLRSHPLSERGEGTASGRSDSEAVNKRAGCVAQPSKM